MPPLASLRGDSLAPTRAPRVRMVVLGFLVLYLELALIRWISGYVQNFGYFAGFVLLGAFLGLGIGCLLKEDRSVTRLVPLLLLVVVVAAVALQVEIHVPDEAGSVFWSQSFGRRIVPVPVPVLIPLFFLVVTLLFVGLGQPMGTLFAQLPRLPAYTLNIAGSLLGIAAFALGSWKSHPPVVWFAVIAVLLLPFLSPRRRLGWAAHAAVLAALVATAAVVNHGDDWGPYYRESVERGGDGVWWLVGNGIPGIYLASEKGLQGHPFYGFPYGGILDAHRKQPGAPYAEVLVIGCGGGNDVAFALSHGARHVDAVDINPWVIEAGRALHPDKPLSSPRVRVTVADGRAFIRSSARRWDLVVYGLPDSTFSLDRTNLRVESFLFTSEAFRDIRDHLTQNGVFVLYNYYRSPWLVAKLRGMLRESFGREPLLVRFGGELAPAALAAGPGLRSPPPAAERVPEPATDDWPFFYLLERRMPAAYLVSLLLVGTISAALLFFALRKTAGGSPASSPDPRTFWFQAALFWMGAAFVLLETRSLATFGLYFGTTWWTSVIVFAAIHVSILLAVLVTATFPRIPVMAGFVALLAALAAAWLVPQTSFLAAGAGLRAVLVSGLAFLPIFCANVLFARLFRDSREGNKSMAFNLVGGLVGGLAEYVSLLVGFRALLLVAGAFYLLALGSALRMRRAPDALGASRPEVLSA